MTNIEYDDMKQVVPLLDNKELIEAISDWGRLFNSKFLSVFKNAKLSFWKRIDKVSLFRYIDNVSF